MEVFPDCHHCLIEPVQYYNHKIKRTHEAAGIGFQISNFAASRFDGAMNLAVSSVTGGANITHARLTDAFDGENTRTVSVKQVDRIFGQ